MSLDDIKALPVREWAAPDRALFLWAIDPMLPQALDVMAAWGFTFKTVAFYWAKRCRASDGWHIGTGYWTRVDSRQPGAMPARHAWITDAAISQCASSGGGSGA